MRSIHTNPHQQLEPFSEFREEKKEQGFTHGQSTQTRLFIMMMHVRSGIYSPKTLVSISNPKFPQDVLGLGTGIGDSPFIADMIVSKQIFGSS
jgi:hypothetical protein